MRAAVLPLPTSARRLLQLCLLALSLALAVAVLPSSSASAAAPTVAQCNGIANGGGEGIDCSITVVNTFDTRTGVGGSTVTVRSCTGAANDATTCTGPTTTTYPDVTTTLDQCNGSAAGGGGTATCTVTITNNITGDATATPATVRQCIGSGGAGTAIFCDPVQNTSGATIDQCNGSVAGGGALTCTVAADSSVSALLPVAVDQCNGSATGGGAFLTCRTSITTNLLAAPAPQQPAPTTPAPALSPATSAPGSATPVASAPASPATAPAASPVASSPAAPASPAASPAASTAPAASPSAPATRAPAAPAPLQPAAPAAPAPLQPAAPVVGVPLQPAQPAGPGQDAPAVDSVPDSAVLPDALTAPVVGPSVQLSGGDSTSVGGEFLPATGADTDLLVSLGLLTLTAGGALLVAGRRPRGRHVLR